MELVLDLFSMFLFILSNVTEMLTRILFLSGLCPMSLSLCSLFATCVRKLLLLKARDMSKGSTHMSVSHTLCVQCFPFAPLSQVPKMQPAGGPPTVPTTEYIICSGSIEIDAATSTWKRA